MNDGGVIDYLFFGGQLLNFFLARWVGKNFVTQPDWNVPGLFQNPLLARLLVIGPQVVFFGLIVAAFFLIVSPWWFLVFSVSGFILIASPPYRS